MVRQLLCISSALPSFTMEFAVSSKSVSGLTMAWNAGHAMAMLPPYPSLRWVPSFAKLKCPHTGVLEPLSNSNSSFENPYHDGPIVVNSLQVRVLM